MNDLTIVPANAQDVKRAIAAYSRQASETLSTLYAKYQEFNLTYWNGELPDAVLAIAVEMHDKKLAHYAELNGYQIPNAIEFNRNFIALNWTGPVVEQPDRTIIDHVLLHEMIHLYLQGVKGETYKDQQAAHGRTFRREAERLGIKGKGRLMACPYPVHMPISAPKARKLRREQEAQDNPDRDTEASTPAPTQPAPPELDTRQLLEQLRQQATIRLDTTQLAQFEKHLTAAAAVLTGEAAPRRPAKRFTYEEKLGRAIKKCFSGSTEQRLYQGEVVMNQEIKQAITRYQQRIAHTPTEDDKLIKNWLEMQLEKHTRQYR